MPAAFSGGLSDFDMLCGQVAAVFWLASTWPTILCSQRQAAAADSRVELPGLTPAPEPTATPGNRKITDRSGKLRKVSNRLFAENASLPALPAASPPAPRQSAGLSAGRSAEGEAGALALLEPLAEAARLLAVLQWREALDVLGAAEEGLRGSAFALGLEGRARLEGGDLKGAVRAFRLMREADPGCLEGVDHYSTALWYTGAFAELASLARDALAWDRWAPEAWCAAGNCMSLQKDHATALKYFRRALQLDKNSVYAHTLCGHELQALDDLEGALQSYRAALALQPLHYNAWYGMSQVTMASMRHHAQGASDTPGVRPASAAAPHSLV